MNITHASRTSFYREFYAIDVKKDGTLDLRIRTLNIFQRALRCLFGVYSNTIWNQSKSTDLKNRYPNGWKTVEDSIVDPTVFSNVFKIPHSQTTVPSDRPALFPISGRKEVGLDQLQRQSKKIIPKERPAPGSMSNWKEFGRKQLQMQLMEIGLKFKESTEKGDCFFDSAAYLLTLLRGDKQYTAQDVRRDISDFLKSKDVPHDTYRKLLSSTHVDGHSYESYCENIGKSATKGYDPIWGDNLAIQIVCDMYNVNVNIHSVHLLEATRLDLLDGGQYEDFAYVSSEDNKILVCTKIVPNNFAPNPERPNSTATEKTINFARIENGPWAHFLPAVTAR